MCDSKRKKFVKEQEASGLLISLGIKTSLNKILSLGSFVSLEPFFQVNTRYKMNEIINTSLLVGDEFMPEMHLRYPGLTYRACGPFTKNKERIKKLKKQEIQDISFKTN